MADKLAEAKFKTVNDILVGVKDEDRVHTLADIVVNVETTQLVNTVADKMADAVE